MNAATDLDVRSFGLAQLRKAAYDRSDCTNGPDDEGNWPCDPQVLFGAPLAECQACGRVAAWGEAVESDAD